MVEMCLYLGTEREGGQKERERVAEMRGTDRQIKMLLAYRSISEDSGRGSLKLLFGGGEKAGKKLFLSKEMRIKPDGLKGSALLRA